MAMRTLSLLLATVAAVASTSCPIQFDNRVPESISPETFDTPESPFSPDFVFGKGLAWSKILKFPSLETSLFDQQIHTIPVEVTISDASIFEPSGSDAQTGFRRAELLPASNNGTDPSTIGIKTLHFSLRRDEQRPLNYSHEYQLVFLETADFSTNQFALKVGAVGGQPANQSHEVLILQSNVADPTGTKDIFTHSFTKDVWHNFGVTLNFDENTTQVYYSLDNSPLVASTDAVKNDVSGQGQFHFRLLKKPMGDDLTDITKEGYQETGIDEAIIFGGVFEEDSTDGCISLSP